MLYFCKVWKLSGGFFLICVWVYVFSPGWKLCIISGSQYRIWCSVSNSLISQLDGLLPSGPQGQPRRRIGLSLFVNNSTTCAYAYIYVCFKFWFICWMMLQISVCLRVSCLSFSFPGKGKVCCIGCSSILLCLCYHFGQSLIVHQNEEGRRK